MAEQQETADEFRERVAAQREKNLGPHRFKVGNPGGPGAPRKRPQSEANEAMLRRVMPEKVRNSMNAGLNEPYLQKGSSNADGVSFALLKRAWTGDANAARELRESVEGKSVARHEISGPDNRKWVVEVCYEPLPELSAPAVIDLVADETLSDDETAIRLREQNAETIRKARESEE
jgi:hypothetical protein